MTEPAESVAPPKPTWAEYREWLRTVTTDSYFSNVLNRYDLITIRLLNEMQQSNFWQAILEQQRSIGDEYVLDHAGYGLFPNGASTPELKRKSFESTLDKSYRRNVLFNESWPNPPKDGWITPETWYSALNDHVRTTFVVKYLDGVKFLADKIGQIASEHGHSVSIGFEARNEGHYAAHCGIVFEIDIPRPNWDTERVPVSLEIQIVTQLQDVITQLTHDYYRQRRGRPNVDGLTKWQWDYSSAEFVPNFLGHILHYIDGVIMQVREGGEVS